MLAFWESFAKFNVWQQSEIYDSSPDLVFFSINFLSPFIPFQMAANAKFMPVWFPCKILIVRAVRCMAGDAGYPSIWQGWVFRRNSYPWFWFNFHWVLADVRFFVTTKTGLYGEQSIAAEACVRLIPPQSFPFTADEN